MEKREILAHAINENAKKTKHYRKETVVIKITREYIDVYYNLYV